MSKAPSAPPAAKPRAKAEAELELDEAAPPTGGKKKLILILALVLTLVLAAGGAAAWYFLVYQANAKLPPGQKAHKVETDEDAGKPPVFVALDPFTVNLSPDEGDKFLQVAISVQVPDDKVADNLKDHMPLIRSRILLLLSSQKASVILTEPGKDALIKAISAEISKPYDASGTPQKVRGVFFTSFVIQ